jgi:hypothetical protein
VRVEPGTTVTVTNDDAMVHNLFGAGGWLHGDLGRGESTSHTFREPGTFAYACTLHPGMVGAVVVEDPQLISASSSPLADDGEGAGARTTVAVLGGIALLGAGVATGRAVGRRRPSTD